ncbi:MAG: DUF4402 domain-containing protein [Paludibacteraceae bacterium]|nr:DUF4402 domain-containing protein [Paludibacteraceae bacterium]
MKKLIIVAIVVMVAMPLSMMAQTANTAAAVNLITPLTLTQTSPLHFGTMSVQASTAGTCVLKTDGTRSQTGGVNLSTAVPTATTAAYNVTGAVSTTYIITLPPTISVSDGSNTMTISSLVARAASAMADGTTGTLSATGTDAFTVGGTLTVPAGQAIGAYTGTFNVTVAYN